MSNSEPAKKMKSILSSPDNDLREEEKIEEDFFAGIPRGDAKVNIPDHRSGHHCANLRTLRAQICFTAPLRDAVLFTGIHPRSQNGAFC